MLTAYMFLGYMVLGVFPGPQQMGDRHSTANQFPIGSGNEVQSSPVGSTWAESLVAALYLPAAALGVVVVVGLIPLI